MSTEAWRTVPGWPDYEVSDQGRVRSYSPPGGPGNRQRRTVPVVLKPWLMSGYLTVELRSGAVRQPTVVHRLVLLAFVGPAPEGHQGAHWNGDRTDARLCNLRWASREENEADKRRHGTANIGERHGMSKLTAEQVRAVRRSAADGEPAAALATRFGVTQNYVTSIIAGRARSEVA